MTLSIARLAASLGFALTLAGPALAQTEQTAPPNNPTLPNTSYFGTAPKGILIDKSAPVIASGFGTAPSIVYGTTSGAFIVNVGTGGTASSGVITLGAPAPHGWACQATDYTSLASYDDRVTPTSPTQITITNFPAAGGAATAWTAGDNVAVSCAGY